MSVLHHIRNRLWVPTYRYLLLEDGQCGPKKSSNTWATYLTLFHPSHDEYLTFFVITIGLSCSEICKRRF